MINFGMIVCLLLHPCDPSPEGTVVSHDHVPERWVSSAVETGRTTRIVQKRLPERWLLQIEACIWKETGKPCEVEDTIVEVSKADWLAYPIGSTYVEPIEDDWWSPW